MEIFYAQLWSLTFHLRLISFKVFKYRRFDITYSIRINTIFSTILNESRRNLRHDRELRTIWKKKLGFQQFYLPFIYSLQIFYSSICWLPFLQTLILWFLPLVKYGSKDDLNLFWVNSLCKFSLSGLGKLEKRGRTSGTTIISHFLEGEHALPFSIFSGVVQLLFGIWAIVALPIALTKRNEILMMTNKDESDVGDDFKMSVTEFWIWCTTFM